MQALEVGHLGGVARLNEGLEAHLHQFDGATAKDGLFAEEVGFGLFAEVGFDHATLGAAIGRSVGQGDVTGLAGLVLVHSDQGRHAAALQVLGTHGVAGALGGDHDHVQVSTGNDLVVVHIEAVSEGQHAALLDVRLDVVLVNVRDVLIRQQNHDHVGGANGVSHFGNLQASAFSLGPRGTALAQTDRHIDAGVAQVLSVGMALGAVTNDGDLLALDQGEVSVLIVINLHFMPF